MIEKLLGFIELLLFQPSTNPRRQDLAASHEIKGPAIIEEPFTTVIVYPGHRASTDAHGNYRIALTAQGSFTQLAALSVANLPTGFSAAFTPAFIGPNGASLLTITTTGATNSEADTITRTRWAAGRGCQLEGLRSESRW